MLPKPIIDILAQFDNLLGAVISLNDNNEALEAVANEIKLLKLWREEVESEKQSIYIIGKTSTGKSEFHNFLLDIDNKKDALFKTSTKVETGIIQTLEHCSNREDAFAEIIIKNKNEINKLLLPTQLNSRLTNNALIIPLHNSENVEFFRDNIIAKSERSDFFDIIKAVERVNIKFPLRYLKRHKLIDTPGLASSISITDIDVKEHFQGKSYIFWFLDGSKRTLSDSLTLLDEEKDLVKNNVDRISFIINKFDLMEYDDDVKTEGEVSKRKQELIENLNQELNKFSKNEEKRRIHFTSFKKPKQKFASIDTYQVIEDIENSQIFIEKESHHKNIHSLIAILSKILESIKTNVILKNLKNVEVEREAIELNKKRVIKLKSVSINISGDSKREIINAKNDIFNLTKDQKTNTHQTFKDYVKKFNLQIEGYCQKINNSVIRIEEFQLVNFWKKLQQINEVKKFTFKGKENFFKKYFVDSELEQNKIKLKRYVQEKLKSFDSLISILNADIAEECERKLKEYDYKIHKKNVKRKYYNDQLIIIAKSEEKINDLDAHLLKDIEQRISKWKPENSQEKLENFLALYSLLQEHNIIENKII